MHARNVKFPRIKVGTIASVEEADQAVAAGADAIGLAPLTAGWTSAGGLPEATIALIARRVPERVGTFLLCRNQRLADIVALQRRCGVNTLQLCDPLSPQSHADLQAALPGVALVQVVRLTGRAVMAHAIAAALRANALVLALPFGEADRIVQAPSTEVEGWALAAQIRRAVNVPVFLAGGLRASNVQGAIDQVSPWGVDVGRGVRHGGRLDVAQLKAFVGAVRTPVVTDRIDVDSGVVRALAAAAAE